MKKVSIIVAYLFAFLVLTACGTVAQTETALPATDAEFDALFEDLAKEKSGAEEILTRLKAEQKEQLLSYLMTGFLDGELDGVSFQDKSAAMTKWRVWEQMLEGEMIPLETETPLEYWEEWCDLAMRIYEANGIAFLEEEGCPVSALYISLWLVHGNKNNHAAPETETETEAEPEIEDDLDRLFAELAASGERTNAELDKLKRKEKDRLLDYLMLTFINGGLEGCTYDDGSVGTLQYQTWCGFLGFESLESIAVSPEHDWEEWSAYASMLYERNGYDFLVEHDYPMCARYARLIEK